MTLLPANQAVVGSGGLSKELGCGSLYASLTALVKSPKDLPWLIDVVRMTFAKVPKATND